MASCAVVHLTSVHRAHDARILYKECASLARAGHDVTLIAPHDRDETVQGVRVRAIPRPRGRAERFLVTSWRVFLAAAASRATVCHFHDPELIPVGLLLKLLGRKVVYDVHEDLPLQVLGKTWIPAPLRRTVGRLAALAERLGASAFDGIVAAVPSIAARFPPGKTAVVQNFPTREDVSAEIPADYAGRPSEIVYVGGIDPIRGMRETLRALDALPEGLGVRLALAGRFNTPGFEEELRGAPGWRHVDFHGWLDRRGVAALLARARAGLVTLHPRPNFLDSYPVKMFEYMAAGIPVIASDFPLWKSIVDEAGCGVCVDPTDPGAIAEAVRRIVEDPAAAAAMGRRGARAIREKYNWAAEEAKLLALYAPLFR